MNKLTKLIFVVLFSVITNNAFSQLIYEEDIFHIGRDKYTPIYIGEEWAIEEWSNGLNFWKPWPSNNYGNFKLFLDRTGKVGIGRIPTTHHFEVAGNIWASGVFVTSDERLKNDIKNLNSLSCLNKLSLLDGKSYQKYFSPTIESAEDIQKMIEAGKINSQAVLDFSDTPVIESRLQFGFLAQEFKEIFPELVDEGEGILSIDYTSLIPVIIEGMKELKLMIEEKDEQIKYLENRIGMTSNFSETSPQTKLTNGYLYQPASNPYYNSSIIKFNLPETYHTSVVNIHNMNGALLKEYTIPKGETQITVQPSSLSAGIYICSLIVDGKMTDSKKMVLTN